MDVDRGTDATGVQCDSARADEAEHISVGSAHDAFILFSTGMMMPFFDLAESLPLVRSSTTVQEA